jgi:hypothetical protein
MIIGTVTVDPGLQLSCPYGRGTLTVRLGGQLVEIAVSGLALLVLGATRDALFLILFGPLGVLLITGWFLRDQLRGRASPGSEGSDATAGTPPRPSQDGA